MMNGDWMSGWGAGYMGGWGGLGMILIVALVVIGVVAINARLLRISRGSDTPAAMPQAKQDGDSQQQIAKHAHE